MKRRISTLGLVAVACMCLGGLRATAEPATSTPVPAPTFGCSQVASCQSTTDANARVNDLKTKVDELKSGVSYSDGKVRIYERKIGTPFWFLWSVNVPNNWTWENCLHLARASAGSHYQLSCSSQDSPNPDAASDAVQSVHAPAPTPNCGW